ncbi:MAG: hypothetical protein ACRDPC_13765 [Solirubrobacteraceae bacterium]
MTDHTARPGRYGKFYVHDPGGRQVARPYPTLEAAARHARALTRDRWLLVVVEKSERSASPWDAYVKFFRHIGDERSAEERLLDWWLALPDRAYTRTRARVRACACSTSPAESGSCWPPVTRAACSTRSRPSPPIPRSR